LPGTRLRPHHAAREAEAAIIMAQVVGSGTADELVTVALM